MSFILFFSDLFSILSNDRLSLASFLRSIWDYFFERLAKTMDPSRTLWLLMSSRLWMRTFDWLLECLMAGLVYELNPSVLDCSERRDYLRLIWSWLSLRPCRSLVKVSIGLLLGCFCSTEGFLLLDRHWDIIFSRFFVFCVQFYLLEGSYSASADE